VAGGRWPVAGGRWPVAGGRWPVAGGWWPVATGRWPLPLGAGRCRWPLATAVCRRPTILLHFLLHCTIADCMHNWARTPMMQYNELCRDLAITRQLNKDKSLDADAKTVMRMERLSAIWDLMKEINNQYR
jgi:hypothetical protein